MKLRKAIQSSLIVVVLHVLLLTGLAILNRTEILPAHRHVPTSFSAHILEPEPTPEDEVVDERVQPETPPTELATPVAQAMPRPRPLDVQVDLSAGPAIPVADVLTPKDSFEDVPLRAEDVERPPRWLRGNPQPVYPLVARRRGWEGTVTTRLLVDESGAVTDVKIVGTEGRDVFRQVVLDVARRWRFEPAQHEGRPVKVWLTQPYRFSLNGSRS